MPVTAKSAYNNHEVKVEGKHFRFDHRGFLTTSDPMLIRILEKYDNRPGYWGIVDTRQKFGKPRNKHYLVADAMRLGFQERTGEDPRRARPEELIEYINHCKG